jgi:cob(I)alamin adenosyltransferase
MKIYTKTGDAGQTSLFSGRRVPKNHLRLQTYGTLDELNTLLGLARAKNAEPRLGRPLARLQTLLFIVCSDLATPLPEPGQKDLVTRVTDRHVAFLEQQIDLMTAELPPLQNFILPGGTEVAALLHVARTVCRRAERWLISLAAEEDLGAAVPVLVNRLSDYLFTLARWANFLAGRPDEILDRNFPEIDSP